MATTISSASWTEAVLAATSHIAAQGRAAIAPGPLLVQGSGEGERYFDAEAPTSKLLDNSDGTMAELFPRPPFAPIDAYPPEDELRKDVEMLIDAGARGKTMLTVTKLWTEGTRPQKDAWHEYALASFLMGSSGTSDAFSFIYDKTPRFHPWSATALGTPLGKYFKTSERALQAPSLIGAGDGEPDR